MQRFRSILGLIAGAMLMLSSAAHSLLGWKLLKAELTKIQAPADLTTALALGWHFAGVAMLAFGFIVVALFTHRLRGSAVSLRPAIVIGTTYVVYGTWALVVSKLDPFFLVFVVPGALLLLASIARGDR